MSGSPGGVSRRQLMRAGAAVPAAVWAAPVVTSLRPAVALPGSPRPEPTDKPTIAPTDEPTDGPTTQPTEEPTTQPTDAPTTQPTDAPTTQPTDAPTTQPTDAPTTQPTDAPTEVPTERGKPGGPTDGGPGRGPNRVPSLPATGLDAESLAALGSASVIAGAALLAQSKKYLDEALDD